MNAIAKALRALPSRPYALAVSGGRDSMALLHAFSAVRREELSVVATFDHGTGPAATDAAELVVCECLSRGIPIVAGRAPDEGNDAPRTETAWRSARWAFLRAVAAEWSAVIVTAHTLDDQAETVAMRILRGASARGLAGMAARSELVSRPLLTLKRSELARYSAVHQVPFVEDPTNTDRRFLRNRLRSDLLSALEAVRPGVTDDFLALSRRATEWRHQVAELVDGLGVRRVGGELVIGAGALTGLGRDGLAVVWPEIAARAGVVLDRRGIQRLAQWTPVARAGQHAPLSGGAVVERTTLTFVVRAAAPLY